MNISDKNPWWRAEILVQEDEKLKELAKIAYPCIFPELKKIDLGQMGIYTIRGIRQIGKSTAIKNMIRALLLEKHCNPRAVFYFSCEALHTDRDLFECLDTYLRTIAPMAHLYIFIDEVTFVAEWQRAIKELADDGRLKHTTMILTGSNLIDLTESSELMPGRRGPAATLDVYLQPLDFRAFVQLIEPTLAQLSLDESLAKLPQFQALFDDYLLCGGIPKAINDYYSNTPHTISPYVYEMYRSWITGDILKAKKSLAIFESVVAYLVKSLATPISWYKLGKESHLASHAAAMDYVALMEQLFMVVHLEMIDPSSKQPVFRKNKKIYFTDPLIFDALRALVDGFTEESWAHAKQWLNQSEAVSKKVEQIAIANIRQKFPRLFYWANGHEIDAVIKRAGNVLEFYEIKYQGRVSTREFFWFTKQFPKNSLTVLTRHDYEKSDRVTCIPIAIALAQPLSFETLTVENPFV